MTFFLLCAGGFIFGWVAAAMLYRTRRRQRYQRILGRQGILRLLLIAAFLFAARAEASSTIFTVAGRTLKIIGASLPGLDCASPTGYPGIALIGYQVVGEANVVSFIDFSGKAMTAGAGCTAYTAPDQSVSVECDLSAVTLISARFSNNCLNTLTFQGQPGTWPTITDLKVTGGSGQDDLGIGAGQMPNLRRVRIDLGAGQNQFSVGN